MTDTAQKIRVVLPKKYDLVTGDTFQLFYRGVVEAPNPFCYDILALCEKGKNFPRYFEFLPEEPGEYKLTISVFAADKTLLGQGETLLKVAEPAAPQKPLNILCIGDSLTTGGQWPEEACRRLTATGGNPAGLGLENIAFIGTCGRGDVGYEGYGGWRWENYTSTTIGSMWVVSPGNDKQADDQHSLWQDAAGNIWQLETLADEYLKFNRYMQHTGAMPEGGTLVHFKNAVHRAPVQIEKSSREKQSPFYDEIAQTIDLAAYCKRNGFAGVDAVYILLGANGLAEAHAAGTPIPEHCQNIVQKGKQLADLIHKAYPAAKIRIMGLTTPSVNGGMGANYGATLPYCDGYGYTRYVMELNMAYEAWALEPKYRDFMEFINVSGQFDADYSFPKTEKPVNTRSRETEEIGTNGLHPSHEGYMQIADAAFRNMVHLT